MAGSFARIGAMFQRYVLLHRRSLIRSFDIFFWPVMDLLIWGFVTLYIQQAVGIIKCIPKCCRGASSAFGLRGSWH